MATRSISLQQSEAIRTVTDAVVQSWKEDGPQPQHTLLDAVAGAGKTRTLVDATHEVLRSVPEARILLLAFNTQMAAELRERLSEVHGGTVEIHTVHAFGLRLCSNAMQHIRGDTSEDGGPTKRMRRGDCLQVDPDKAHKTWKALTPQSNHLVKDWLPIRMAIDKWRQDGIPILPDDHPSVIHPRSIEETILVQMLADRLTIDQEEQLYHCLHYGIQIPLEKAYHVCFVDEAQDVGNLWLGGCKCYLPCDLNTLQHLFFRHCVVPPNSRTVLCAVGDPQQAIYAFNHEYPFLESPSPFWVGWSHMKGMDRSYRYQWLKFCFQGCAPCLYGTDGRSVCDATAPSHMLLQVPKAGRVHRESDQPRTACRPERQARPRGCVHSQESAGHA